MPIKKKRKRTKSGKGSKFERELSSQLSLWFTNGTRDDVIWRTSGSGNRATIRGRKGQSTFNGQGDLFPTDPIAQPLFDLFTIELKRGYNEHHMYSVMDCSSNPRSQQEWECWIQQAKAAWNCSKSYSWMVINKRDGREAMVFLPYFVIKLLKDRGILSNSTPIITMKAPLLECAYEKIKGKLKEVSRNFTKSEKICCISLKSLLQQLQPADVLQLAKEVKS